MRLPKFSYLLGAATTVLTTLLMTAGASAHVVVKPAEVGPGTFQTFTTGVPSEKDVPTTGLRVVIPDTLNDVSPNVKPGWTIDIKKEAGPEASKVTEISWTGGEIPGGQRDDFLFSAQTPAKPTTLQWKAYQTYADGTVTAWDQTPPEATSSSSDDDSVTPYSQTKVIDDLAAAKATKAAADANTANTRNADSHANAALVLSGVAVVLTFVTLLRVLSLRK